MGSGAGTAWQARAVAITQAGDDFAAQFAPGMGIDDVIDGLCETGIVRHVELALVRKDPAERSRYLLQRPLPAQHGAHHASAYTLRMQLGVTASMAPASYSPQLRKVGTIALPSTGIARYLMGNGRRCSFQGTGNGPHTEAALSHPGHGNSALRLKLLASGRFLYGYTLQERCCTSSLRPTR